MWTALSKWGKSCRGSFSVRGQNQVEVNSGPNLFWISAKKYDKMGNLEHI